MNQVNFLSIWSNIFYYQKVSSFSPFGRNLDQLWEWLLQKLAEQRYCKVIAKILQRYCKVCFLFNFLIGVQLFHLLLLLISSQ